ncbi:MAG: hypothetical protein WCO25_03535 [Candidatus Uhrbacteria bacterium]
MPGILSRIHSISFTVIFLALLLANAALWQSPVLGAALLAAFLVTFGSWIGRFVAPTEHGPTQTWVGGWMLLSAVMVAGAGVYYVWQLTTDVSLVIAMTAGPIAWTLSTKSKLGWFQRPHDGVSEPRHRVPAAFWIAASLVVAGLASTAWLLIDAATTDAVRTIWERVPPAALVSFGLSALVLAGLLFHGKERAVTISLTTATLGVFLLAAYLVFPLGFGFDPFIHLATEEHIARFGTITPKPLYYVGQYALILFAHQAFSIPIATLNALLVPLLAALLLPLAWFSAATHLLKDKNAGAATLAAIFLVPLASFILTTPQGLANLWVLLLVLAAIPTLVRDESPRVWPLALPALAALVTHPIAGIPAMLFVILLASDPRRNGGRVLSHLVFWTTVVAGSVAIPLSFVANALRSTGTPGIDPSNLSNLFTLSNLSVFFSNRFNPLLDFVYLYGLNATVLFLALAAVGYWISRRQMRGALRILVLMAAMLAVNWAILSTAVDFSFLIDYERQNFAARLVPMILFFLAPLVILAVGTWINRVRPGPVSLRVATVVLLAALSTASFYLAYPRNDAYEAGHGFNVSQADVDAVHAIEKDAAGTPYVVLANQTVSAAAVRELGFVRYYGDLFFYPIPTGGDLYSSFLAMNEKPSVETAKAALDLMNARCSASPECTQPLAKTVYFVVNQYWWEAPRIVETAKQNAASWWALDNAAVHVFKYQPYD